ncbi:antitoxin VbhA family protein [Hymenobacter sp. NST-14]|uniref:antitoxin VbhA family protein n=1 Tax=Hymenobacter piscis TaxID=2839984 RepID=UPI001C02B2F5|nr:antitoxin VbhA family protein [Hymenobacter piscis]MBT9395082.1 antitoxin VbhA family protein [Hymenobacter piscis]
MQEPITFSEREKTPAQRQELIDNARAWSVAQGAVPSVRAEALYARYVAGELTLQGVTEELRRQDAPRVAAAAAQATSGTSSTPTITPRRAEMQPEQDFLT